MNTGKIAFVNHVGETLRGFECGTLRLGVTDRSNRFRYSLVGVYVSVCING